MKFTWFNLMPWPYLPDDFREKHHSVWVDIPNTLYDPQKGTFRLSPVHGSTRICRAVGFDGIGCERASSERLRTHAVSQPHCRRPRTANLKSGASPSLATRSHCTTLLFASPKNSPCSM